MSYFPQLAEDFELLLAALRGQRVRVIGHARPDGDCIGAQVAMSRLLSQQGVDAKPLVADGIPSALEFLARTVEFEPMTAESLDGATLLFVDCADSSRVGFEANDLLVGQAFTGNIDHHISNTDFARINVVDASSAATCEIVAGLVFDLDWEVDAETAQALLTGIMSDTGRFCYPATSSRVFEICGRLVACGARPQATAQSLFENEPITRYKLLERFLASLRLECDDRVGIGRLVLHDFLDTGAGYEETEGFVDYARAIRGARIGVYLEERKATVKVSLRADDPRYRVDRVARQFGGGGHACAAAFSSDRSLDELEPQILAAVGRVVEAVESEPNLLA